MSNTVTKKALVSGNIDADYNLISDLPYVFVVVWKCRQSNRICIVIDVPGNVVCQESDAKGPDKKKAKKGGGPPRKRRK